VCVCVCEREREREREYEVGVILQQRNRFAAALTHKHVCACGFTGAWGYGAAEFLRLGNMVLRIFCGWLGWVRVRLCSV
jgi:hypothetical protein